MSGVVVGVVTSGGTAGGSTGVDEAVVSVVVADTIGVDDASVDTEKFVVLAVLVDTSVFDVDVEVSSISEFRVPLVLVATEVSVDTVVVAVEVATREFVATTVLVDVSEIIREIENIPFVSKP